MSDADPCKCIVQMSEIPSEHKITSVYSRDCYVEGVFGILWSNRSRFQQSPGKYLCLIIHLKYRDLPNRLQTFAYRFRISPGNFLQYREGDNTLVIT